MLDFQLRLARVQGGRQLAHVQQLLTEYRSGCCSRRSLNHSSQDYISFRNLCQSIDDPWNTIRVLDMGCLQHGVTTNGGLRLDGTGIFRKED